jgi:hypothetical protein
MPQVRVGRAVLVELLVSLEVSPRGLPIDDGPRL